MLAESDLKFALDVPNSGKYGVPSTLVDLAVTAEEAGWDGFFIWDHLVATKRDGAFVIPNKAGLTDEMSPEATAEMIDYVNAQRTSGAPFDFVHAGFSTGDPTADRVKVQQYREAGVTWWLEHIYASRITPAKLRAFIAKGPPRQA